MPARSSVYTLPPELREQLDQRLVASGFGGYDALAEWLAESGHEISRSAIGRYGKTFKDRIGLLQEVTEQARVTVETIGDDEDALGAATMAIAKQQLFSALVDFKLDPDSVDLNDLLLNVSRLSNSSVRLNEYRSKVRQRAKAAAAEVDSVARAGGLSDDAAAQIRAKILGVAA
ncbi:MAG: DUF3486 family protein [Bacteroidota bacterium]